MDPEDIDFATTLYSINEVTQKELKQQIDATIASQSDHDLWILSRMIRLAPPEILKPLIDQIAKATIHNRGKMLSAEFASSHLLRRADQIGQNDAYKWVRSMPFPGNPIYAAHIYNIVAAPAFCSALPSQWDILQSPNLQVQREAAAALARSAKSPANFLRRVLATLSPNPPSDVEKLTIERQKPTLTRGLILVASCLTKNPLNALEYYTPLSAIINITPNTQLEISTATIAQELLAQIMFSCPTAFHTLDVFNPALVQTRVGNLSNMFLRAILGVFGLTAIRKLVIPLLERWIDSAATTGLSCLREIAPYAAFLPPEAQLDVHAALVGLCKRRPLSRDLFMTTASFMASSNPAQSPHISEFLPLAERSPFAAEVFAALHGALEPKTAPVAHPMRDHMKIREVEKVDAFVQVEVKKRNIIVQCDVRRDPRMAPKKEAAPKPAPVTKPLPMPVTPKETPAEVEGSDDDIDIDIDLDASPDSDDE